MTTASKVVKLNVGGVSYNTRHGKLVSIMAGNIQETFATSTTTLLSGGETFFSSLLSGRHESERDENGAYFIDRK